MMVGAAAWFFGALAFGIGTSEVEVVLATQCLPQNRLRDLAVTVEGELPLGVTAKDVVLGLIGRTGISEGQGNLVEYRGSTIRALSMEGRMTVCNMSIEWGAKAGMVAPDDTTYSYIERKPHAPKGAAWEAALDHWRSLESDPGSEFDQEISIDASVLEPRQEMERPRTSRLSSIDPSTSGQGTECYVCGDRTFGQSCPRCDGELCSTHAPQRHDVCRACEEEYDTYKRAASQGRTPALRRWWCSNS